MSIVTIKACYDLESALNYQELNNGVDRTASKCSNVEPDFRTLAKIILKKYKRQRQAYTVIHSFSREELDYTNPEHIELAKQLSYELMNRMYPNTPFQIIIHTDSKGHCVHAHATALNHDLETGKALQNTSWYQLKKANDELMQDNFMEVCKRKEHSIDQQEYWSTQRDSDKYSWQEDMKNRIDKALDVATTLSEFSAYLGVECVQGKFYKNDGKSLLKHFSFAFKDESGKEHKKRGDKLGSCYTPEAIQLKLKENQQKAIMPMSDWVKLKKGNDDMEKKILNVTQSQPSVLVDMPKPLNTSETNNKLENIDTIAKTSRAEKDNMDIAEREKRRRRIEKLRLKLQYYENQKFELDEDSSEYKNILKKIREINEELLELSSVNLKENQKSIPKNSILNESLISYESQKDKGYSFC